MTYEQINAAIAETCGWTNVSARHRSGRCPGADELYVGHEFLPDYCSNLNAMHEAEHSLTYVQLCNYIDLLIQFSPEAAVATARQRAEAFLRALGKWKPTIEDSSANQKEAQG